MTGKVAQCGSLLKYDIVELIIAYNIPGQLSKGNTTLGLFCVLPLTVAWNIEDGGSKQPTQP
jgi:hypothetical protein